MCKYVLSALVLSLASNLAMAQSEDGGRLVKSMTIQELAKILEDEGTRVIKIFPKENELLIKVDGYNVYLVLWDDGRVMGGRFAVKCAKGITTERINDWNHKRWGTRAFLNKDRDPQLEFDIDLRHGVSPECIAGNVHMFRQRVSQFTSHLVGGVPAPKKTLPLADTTWVGREDLEGFGELSFELHADGTVAMTDEASKVKGKWSRDGSKVVIVFANCIYVGQQEGTTISGTAVMIKNDEPSGEPWRFSVTKQ